MLQWIIYSRDPLKLTVSGFKMIIDHNLTGHFRISLWLYWKRLWSELQFSCAWVTRLCNFISRDFGPGFNESCSVICKRWTASVASEEQELFSPPVFHDVCSVQFQALVVSCTDKIITMIKFCWTIICLQLYYYLILLFIFRLLYYIINNILSFIII